ncbi:AMP-binding protein [Thalassospira profundimaris]|uniref:AMP-dependent synthetase n=1 Tax=Thalassospira profundimaris TaxID=502049 RepID=A0A367WVD3_9PROT|nr:AMP-binding protein [Thalassospira profundimaris]RCK44600.1 AMP-dependent synthetase [Thalassospira profundimaris]
MLFERIRNHPGHRPALRTGTAEINYGDLIRHVEERSIQLQDVDVLGIALDNGIDWLLWDLAALHTGIICIPLPPFFTKDQIDHSIATGGITHMVTPGGLVATGFDRSPLIPEGTAKITFTSGSTGTPKGVCLSETAMFNVAHAIHAVLGDDFVGTHACVLPLAVLLENVAGVYAGLIAGCTIHLTGLQEFGSQYHNLYDVLKQARANSVILVPEILRALMMQVHAKGPLPDLKFIAVGGARVAPRLIATARQLGLPVYEGYGLSECASVLSMNIPGKDKPGTAGTLLPHVKAEIRDGEIYVHRPGFLGYIGATDQSDGTVAQWFATGDIGDIDADGFVHVTGRKKNVLITSHGRNISPEWPESVLLAQPEIYQAIVYGDDQPHLSALIVPSNATANIAAAIETTNTVLPDYAQIRDFQIVPPFSVENGCLTGNGRPKRDAISARYLSPQLTPEPSMNFYDRLVAETAEARASLYHVPQLVDGLQGNISRSTYVAYLTEAYHHVKHTVPFLMAMGSRLPEDKRWLHKAIIEYLEEEEGHEEWILNDIEAAGGNREKARNATPNLETQVMVAYNYDYIARKNPVGFFGMVFMLESTSTQIASQGADAVMNGLDLPKSAFSYLFSHGSLDIEHMKFFEQTVNKITDPDDQAAIIEVAQNTFRLFANLFAAIPHEGQRKHVA